ncbi:MAG: lamin tail domain-containing protein [Bacteroidales bacterium]|nr:lamin tail domain-containing protein [Bacteroidales bacterium]
MQPFFTKLTLLILCCIALITPLSAQMIDDFSDGDFTNNPVWSGDDSLFQVNTDLQLQLNATAAGVAMLTTENHRINNTEWQFWIKLNFSPSSDNFARVYLAADSNNLLLPLNGYFLQFGEIGNKDAIELFRQEGETITSICRSTDSIIAKKFSARIKVVCDNSGTWSLLADMTGGDSFLLLATGINQPDFSNNFCGIFTKYTSSNVQNIFFDDFYIGDEILDLEPPFIEKLTTLSTSSLQITFNEPVSQNSAENPSNYYIDSENWHPASALLLNSGKDVLLTFDQEWMVNQNYTLIINNLSDYSGNVAPQLTAEFAWVQVQPYDVIINEIMADPIPVVALPEWEYIELYNRAEYPISLHQWIFKFGSTQKTFSDITIAPHDYLILCDEDAIELFSSYGNTYGLSYLSLTNSGQSLILLDNEGTVISQVNYSDVWYQDELKKNGGWSLELIDPNNFCGAATNWTASIHHNGGTPGTLNSVHGENSDEDSPLLLRAEYFNEYRINIYFSETMNPATVANNSHWKVDHQLQIAAIFPTAPDYVSAQIIFSTPIQNNEFYTLTVTTDQITDCSGNFVEKGTQVLFAKPETVEPNDIIINEILPQPANNGAQYVELYNRSSKNLDIKQLRFIFEKTTGTDSSHIMLPSFLLFPQSYCVLTKSPEKVLQQYDTPFPETLITVADLPTMIASEGIIRIALIENPALEIDAFRYSETMHAALLNDYKGISLERLNPERPSQDNTNWHSAAETAGFGTPGYKNSQFDDGNGEDEISVDPEIFSPDNDGTDDYLNIRFQFDESGYTMNVFIFDARGYRIRHLQNNVSVGTEGAISWDGKDDAGQLANAGIYIIYIEVFDLQGHVKRWKKTGTLGVKF